MQTTLIQIRPGVIVNWLCVDQIYRHVEQDDDSSTDNSLVGKPCLYIRGGMRLPLTEEEAEKLFDFVQSMGYVLPTKDNVGEQTESVPQQPSDRFANLSASLKQESG